MRLTQRPIIAATALVLASLLSGCATQTAEPLARGEVFDPFESTNRQIHEFNKVIDRNFFRPASTGYVSIIPAPIVSSFTNFSENLSTPGDVLDALLQGDLEAAGNGVFRFIVNSTIGFAGLGDPASAFQIPLVDTDFGETLHVWGFGEGAYVELPLLGPSTQRDAVGVIVNLLTNPLAFAPDMPIKNIGLYAEVLEQMDDRGNFAATIDAILYESADSYAQARIIFLQNRRFELAGDGPGAYLGLYHDPFADIYGDPYAE